MALLSEGKVVSDVVKWEVDENVWDFCREGFIATSGEDLDIGDLVQKVIVDVDEVQTATVTGTESAGSYVLRIFDPDAGGGDGAYVNTALIAYNAALAVVQEAIDDALGGGRVTASGTPVDDTFVLTFVGSGYKGIDVPLVTVPTLPTDVTAWTFAETTKGSVTSTKLVKCTDPNVVAGICLENLGVLTADTVETVCLVRGPAIVDRDQIDYNSIDESQTDEALERLGIHVRSEPTKTTTQST